MTFSGAIQPSRTTSKFRESGFSLVELSIVLVILGLLTGGILAGQSLIRAAELRAVSTEYSRYNAAINSFRDKYFALPGDMPTAVKFWTAQAGGTADGTDAACAALDVNTPSTTQATCNGNGDGRVSSYGNTAFAPIMGYEVYRFWQHLANAGLIEGSYTGVLNTTFGDYSGIATSLGRNVPRSKVNNAGWLFVYWGNSTYAPALPSNYGHVMTFGAPWIHEYTFGPVIKPEEAWNIDTKMDDGRPATGNVMTTDTSAPNCIDGNTTSANYLLSLSGNSCGLVFKAGL